MKNLPCVNWIFEGDPWPERPAASGGRRGARDGDSQGGGGEDQDVPADRAHHPARAFGELGDCNLTANRYTRPENLAWSHSVFIQYSLCIKCRFMKPLSLSSIANTECIFIQSIPPKLLKEHF